MGATQRGEAEPGPSRLGMASFGVTHRTSSARRAVSRLLPRSLPIWGGWVLEHVLRAHLIQYPAPVGGHAAKLDEPAREQPLPGLGGPDDVRVVRTIGVARGQN